MSDFYNNLKSEIGKSDSKKILVHSDLLRGFKFQLPPNEKLLDAHCEALIGLGKDIYMPTFNYDFSKTRVFDVAQTQSKVGVINEHFRKKHADWQIPVPVFSMAGTGSFPDINSENLIDPFNEDSVFAFLHRTDSDMMYYGANFSASTIIHYVERISNVLSYRYDKLFEGDVIYNGVSNEVLLKLHVRPMGVYLDYDWVRLEEDLINDNLLKVFTEGATRIKMIRINDLVEYWLEKIKADPLYLLDKQTKEWVVPLLDKLGRPFLITDFEKDYNYEKPT